jgi:hypothetical protein
MHFSVDDMLAILFPWMVEDIEFLVPAEITPVNPFGGQEQTSNAEAGSSRLASSL